MQRASPPGNQVETHDPTPSCTHALRNTTSTKDSTNTTRNQRRKRRRDDDEKGPPERIKKLDGRQYSSPFACPFYLYDRHKWHNCLRNYTLNRIVDVRLHLTRAHSLPPQCPICGEEFTEDSARSGSADHRLDEHVQRRTCQPPLYPAPPRHDRGLTRDQFESVRAVGGRRNGRGLTDPAAEKWFEIWDIIFPEKPRPPSPYINDHPDVQRIRDMNDDILAGEEWRDLIAPIRESSPTLQNASRSTIATITERLLAFYRRRYQDDSGHIASPPEEISTTFGQSHADGVEFDFESIFTPDQATGVVTGVVHEPNRETEEACRSTPSPEHVE